MRKLCAKRQADQTVILLIVISDFRFRIADFVLFHGSVSGGIRENGEIGNRQSTEAGQIGEIKDGSVDAHAETRAPTRLPAYRAGTHERR
jgi:hypothetical protein